MGELIGPLSFDELNENLKRENAAPDTFVREGETGKWLTADTLQNFPSTTQSIRSDTFEADTKLLKAR